MKYSTRTESMLVEIVCKDKGVVWCPSSHVSRVLRLLDTPRGEEAGRKKAAEEELAYAVFDDKYFVKNKEGCPSFFHSASR